MVQGSNPGPPYISSVPVPGTENAIDKLKTLSNPREFATSNNDPTLKSYLDKIQSPNGLAYDPNTLAYDPVANVIKLFTAVSYDFSL